MLADEQAWFAKDVSLLIKEIFLKGYSCTFGEAYRTPEQAEIYAKQGKGIKNSLHCKRLAIDLNLFSPEGKYLTEAKEYTYFGIYWKSLGKKNRWGGDFKNGDANHFERNA